ncbi:hypothetical protein T484DRAFT_1924170 [Baffinella frigidus]|nr:hypothetical protein T484DRAFT_1924170 [Cryptophyta sp. CCMP2293]|mmetsp:Transcript_10921/g.26492  ORF Transcript_10921/g.26492 Transcript_10921/m.26492 type:complete len:166 (-) Transcript_10921:137-634(-)
MINLCLSAEAENVKKILCPSDHTWFVRLRCTQCQDETPNAIGLSRDMTVDGVRGASVTLQYKCKGCGRVHDINLNEEAEGDCWEPDGRREGEARRVAQLECRGIDPVSCEVRDGFTVVAVDGTVYEDCDLSDDWMDVDEKGIPVSISNTKYTLAGAKADGKKKKK